MPLGRAPGPFFHRDWIFEIKHDGFRALLYSDKDGVRLVSRNGNTFKSFPGLCDGLHRDLMGRHSVLDGEIVVLDRKGRSQFRLRDSLRSQREITPHSAEAACYTMGNFLHHILRNEFGFILLPRTTKLPTDRSANIASESMDETKIPEDKSALSGAGLQGKDTTSQRPNCGGTHTQLL